MEDSTIESRDEMSCQELVELVTDYFEDALALPDRVRFDAHLADCPGCREYLDQMRVTLEITGDLKEDALSSEARDTLLDAFRDWRKR